MPFWCLRGSGPWAKEASSPPYSSASRGTGRPFEGERKAVEGRSGGVDARAAGHCGQFHEKPEDNVGHTGVLWCSLVLLIAMANHEKSKDLGHKPFPAGGTRVGHNHDITSFKQIIEWALPLAHVAHAKHARSCTVTTKEHLSVLQAKVSFPILATFPRSSNK